METMQATKVVKLVTGDGIDLTKTPLPTRQGKMVLDEIIGVVLNHRPYGYIGFSIGETADITAYIATRCKKPLRTVAGVLGHLVKQGLLYTGPMDHDDHNRAVYGNLSLTHASWYRYSGWSFDRIRELETPYSDAGDGLEGWLAWDGMDCTSLGEGHPRPFCVELGKRSANEYEEGGYWPVSVRKYPPNATAPG